MVCTATTEHLLTTYAHKPNPACSMLWIPESGNELMANALQPFD